MKKIKLEYAILKDFININCIAEQFEKVNEELKEVDKELKNEFFGYYERVMEEINDLIQSLVTLQFIILKNISLQETTIETYNKLHIKKMKERYKK